MPLHAVVAATVRMMIAGTQRSFVKVMRIWQVLLLSTGVPITAQAEADANAGCPTHPHCSGCGCAGGPGYRAPNGSCVGFRNLARVCGTPPTQRCSFENAPGTGDNAVCAMRPRAPH